MVDKNDKGGKKNKQETSKIILNTCKVQVKKTILLTREQAKSNPECLRRLIEGEHIQGSKQMLCKVQLKIISF